jgi:peptide/nickel transport system substrate-binding protein
MYRGPLHHRKFVVMLAPILALSLGLAACGSPSKGTPEGNTSAPAATGGTLHVGMAADMQQFDPQVTTRIDDQIMLQQIFSSLVRVNDKADIVGDLAEKWEVTDSGYVFHLRQGVKFHNGRAMTADDVVFSLQRVQDPKTASPRRTNFANVDTITAPDANTVTITMKKPDASFLEKLAVIKVLAKENIGELSTHPIGTGPFMFKEWLIGQHLMLVKNPDYFVKGLPKLDAVEFKPMPDDETRVVALKTGQVDFIEQVPARYIKELGEGANTQVFKVLGTYRDVLHINTKKKPFDDVRVRQAIAYAVDRDRIQSVIMEGQSQANQSVLPPGHWARKEFTPDQLYTYDLAKAADLLKQAGVNKLTTSIIVDNRFAWNTKMAELLKDSLSQIGITANIQLLEGAQFNKTVFTDRNYDMAFEPWGAQVNDPDDFYYRQFHTGEANNALQYSNPQVDQLLEKARVTLDSKDRAPIYQQIQEILQKEVPAIPIQTVMRAHGATKKVQGFAMDPTANIFFDSVSISK